MAGTLVLKGPTVQELSEYQLELHKHGVEQSWVITGWELTKHRGALGAEGAGLKLGTETVHRGRSVALNLIEIWTHLAINFLLVRQVELLQHANKYHSI